MESVNLVLDVQLLSEDYDLDCIYSDDDRMKTLQFAIVDIITKKLYQSIENENCGFGGIENRYQFIIKWTKINKYNRSMTAEMYREEQFVRNNFQESIQIERKFMGFLRVSDYKVRVFLEMDEFIVDKNLIASKVSSRRNTFNE